MFCRMALLLGPPGSGKTTLLQALSGKLDSTLKVKKIFLLLICLYYLSLIHDLEIGGHFLHYLKRLC